MLYIYRRPRNRIMKNIVLCTFLLTLSISALMGQEAEHFFFKDSYILKPFLSEIRSTAIKAELAWLNKLDENYYVSDYASRPFIEVHLGTELPIYYVVNRQKDFKFSTCGYIGNILLIDMFETNTAPVINTDYFFGLKAAAIKYIDHPYIRNIGLKLVPLYHESTHIGDEFSIHGYNDLPAFRRVNVSYEEPPYSMIRILSNRTSFQQRWVSTGSGTQAKDTIQLTALKPKV